MANQLAIEVVYALPEQSFRVCLSVAAGTSVREAVRLSGIHPSLANSEESLFLGVWGRRVLNPDAQTVNAGDRIELYRPLWADPKEIRKQRAARARASR